jgi:cell division septum initiation protein DivIVA
VCVDPLHAPLTLPPWTSTGRQSSGATSRSAGAATIRRPSTPTCARSRPRSKSPAADSLAATAGTQVQGIIAAAESAAAQIESDARASAKDVREQADADAQKTRADAVARAQAHVAAVSEATATLLARVESMDGEAGALVDSLRAGAGRLSADLAAAQQNMGELYDAASGGGASSVAEAEPAPAPAPSAHKPRPAPELLPIAIDEPAASPAPAAVAESSVPNGDLDGARLIALNMALNGDSREDVGRYLADYFDLADREKLVEEVYAAIDG